jgi:tetratricopeptide (TPR) repeat protein
MEHELTKQIYEIMEREMQEMGQFIVKKQCILTGANPEKIEPRDLPSLASKLSEVMQTFFNDTATTEIYTEIRELGNLDQIVDEEKSEEIKLEMLEDLGKGSLFAGEWDKAQEYFNQLLKRAEANNDKVAISRYLRRMGFMHHERAEFDQALEYYQKALNNATEAEDAHEIADCYNGIGNTQWYMGDYPKAIKSYEEGAKNAKEAGNMNGLGVANIGLGNIRSDLYELKEASKYFKEALTNLQKTENYQQIARA